MVMRRREAKRASTRPRGNPAPSWTCVINRVGFQYRVVSSHTSSKLFIPHTLSLVGP